MNAFHCHVIDTYRRAEAEMLFRQLPNGGQILLALRESEICQHLGGRQALLIRYEKALIALQEPLLPGVHLFSPQDLTITLRPLELR